jgi:hypothetical protein
MPITFTVDRKTRQTEEFCFAKSEEIPGRRQGWPERVAALSIEARRQGRQED